MVPIIYGAIIYYWQEKGKREKAKEEKNVDERLLSPFTFHLSPVFWGLYTSILVVSVWAVLQKLGAIGTLFYQTGDTSFNQYLGENFRAFGPFESPNYLAMYIVPAAFLAIGTNLKLKSLSRVSPRDQRSKFWNGAFYLSLVLPLLALYYSQSRAGWIALAGSLSIIGIVWLYRCIKNKSWRVMLITLSIILFPLFIILIFKYGLRGTDIIRLQIYQYSWQMLRENWLWGVGLGNFQHYLSQMVISDDFRTNFLPFAYHPHNLYLALCLNFGILGLAALVGIVIVAIKSSYAKAGGWWLEAALMAVLVHGLFDTTYFKNDLSVLFWLIISLTIVFGGAKNAASD